MHLRAGIKVEKHQLRDWTPGEMHDALSETNSIAMEDAETMECLGVRGSLFRAVDKHLGCLVFSWGWKVGSDKKIGFSTADEARIDLVDRIELELQRIGNEQEVEERVGRKRRLAEHQQGLLKIFTMDHPSAWGDYGAALGAEFIFEAHEMEHQPANHAEADLPKGSGPGHRPGERAATIRLGDLEGHVWRVIHTDHTGYKSYTWIWTQGDAVSVGDGDTFLGEASSLKWRLLREHSRLSDFKAENERESASRDLQQTDL